MLTDLSKPTERFDDAMCQAYKDMDPYVLMKEKCLGACMEGLSRLMQTYDKSQLENQICGLALDWLQSLAMRLEKANSYLGSLKLMECVYCCNSSDGEPVDGTETTKMLAYNTEIISDEVVKSLFDRGLIELDGRVVEMWPSEAAALFPHMFETEDDNKKEDDADAGNEEHSA